MNQKGLTPILVPLGIIIILAIVGGIYYFNKTLLTPVSRQQTPLPLSTLNPIVSATPSAVQSNSLYTSSFGFSLINTTNNKVSETGYSIVDSCQKDQTVSSKSKADEVAFLKDGYFDYTGSPSFVLLRMDSIGAGQIGPCGPGDKSPYQFFLKDNQLFKEVENLISDKVAPSQTNFFNDAKGGMIQRFSVTNYSNPTSQLYGITNLRISGFAVPGLGLFREYFIHDPKSKFIVYVSYTISCKQKDDLEQKSNDAGVNFNSDSYIKSLHQLATDCDKATTVKKVTEQILDSLSFSN